MEKHGVQFEIESRWHMKTSTADENPFRSVVLALFEASSFRREVSIEAKVEFSLARF